MRNKKKKRKHKNSIGKKIQNWKHKNGVGSTKTEQKTQIQNRKHKNGKGNTKT